jgi:hypothetical protein
MVPPSSVAAQAPSQKSVRGFNCVADLLQESATPALHRFAIPPHREASFGWIVVQSLGKRFIVGARVGYKKASHD